MDKVFGFFDEVVKIASFVFTLWGRDNTVDHIDFDTFQSTGYSSIKESIQSIIDNVKGMF